jgi:hypothetical protein
VPNCVHTTSSRNIAKYLTKNEIQTFVLYKESELDHRIDQNYRFGQKERKTKERKKENWQNNFHPEKKCCGRKIFKIIENCQQI